MPVDYRVFDKDRDGKTKNDHFAEMLLEAHERGFNPQMVCFERLVRLLGEPAETVSLFGLAFSDPTEIEPPG